jgi:hypothetical protein
MQQRIFMIDAAGRSSYSVHRMSDSPVVAMEAIERGSN